MPVLAMVCLFLLGCARLKDPLGDERLITQLTPIFTSFRPTTALPGELVFVRATFSDPLSDAAVQVEVVRCPARSGGKRDIQCLATHSEELVEHGSAIRDGDMLSYDFVYQVPADTPVGANVQGVSVFTENVLVRARNVERYVTQLAAIAVAPEDVSDELPSARPGAPDGEPPTEPSADNPEPSADNPEPSADNPDALILRSTTPDATRLTPDPTVTNHIRAGTYYSGSAVYFCTPGCKQTSVPSVEAATIRFLAGTAPVLYLITAQKFERFHFAVE